MGPSYLSIDKDIITIIVSAGILLVSGLYYFLTLRQKRKEKQRFIRKTLTDTVSDLASISLEVAKLIPKDGQPDSKTILLRRIYNQQRRYLVNHAEFLLQQIEKLVTDIDYNILAGSFDAIGDYDKAEIYWELSISNSPNNVIKAMNLRGYARFQYFQGKPEIGRKKYKESLELNLPDTDNIRRMRADTYLMWARTERDFSNNEEAQSMAERARAECLHICNKMMQKEMLEYINDILNIDSNIGSDNKLRAGTES